MKNDIISLHFLIIDNHHTHHGFLSSVLLSFFVIFIYRCELNFVNLFMYFVPCFLIIFGYIILDVNAFRFICQNVSSSSFFRALVFLRISLFIWSFSFTFFDVISIVMNYINKCCGTLFCQAQTQCYSTNLANAEMSCRYICF